MNEIAVIVLTFNQRDKTLECLTALTAQTDADYRILVWDNGSEDGTGDAVRQAFSTVHIHEHAHNLGVASGRNAAAQLAIQTFHCRYLLFLDNDILVEPGFVAALVHPFRQHDRLGQTQAKLRFMHDRTLLNDAGGAQIDFMRWQVTPVGFGEPDRGQYDRVRSCIACGGAMMVRVDLFQQLNGFDGRFNPFGPEDMDFSLRLQKTGYTALYIPQAIGYHAVSHTYGTGYSEEYARHKARHWFIFMRRHASWQQQARFFLYGAPYLALRVLVREGRKGNIGAIRGLLRGALDLAVSTIRAPKTR